MDESQLQSKRIDVLLEGYKTLKSEQQARIGFRDNLLYATLAGSGATTAFALTKEGPVAALLAVPWLTLILGWTYLVNDEKISAIGRFIRVKLQAQIQAELTTHQTLWVWETEHRGDELRIERKVVQFVIDVLTFAGTGLGAVVLYMLRERNQPPAVHWLCGVEIALMIFLIFEIFSYLDWRPGQAE